MADSEGSQYERIQKILSDIMNSRRMRESSTFSERSYSDEPILRTGADLRREREDQNRQTDRNSDQQTERDRRREARTEGRNQSRSEYDRKRRARAAAYRQQAEVPRPKVEHPKPPQRPDGKPHTRQSDSGAPGQANLFQDFDLGGSLDTSKLRPAPSPMPQKPSSKFQRPSPKPQNPWASSGEYAARSAWDWLQDRFSVEVNVPAEKLPPVLQKLRDLEAPDKETGVPLRGPELFLEQARLAADFEDDHPLKGSPRYRYIATYSELSDMELRGYFTWRTEWRRGTATTLPYTYAHILAGELINQIGPGDDLARLNELKRMRTRSLELGTQELGTNLALDLDHWIRDYVVYYGLDPKLATTVEERAYADAVAALRSAQKAELCRQSLRSLSQKDMPAPVPTDAELWAAMGKVSTYSLEHSPFFREHPDEAAAVGSQVFRSLVSHCGKRRKIDYVDGLLGSEYDYRYTPFLGVPFIDSPGHENTTIRLTAAETISYRFDRWTVHRGYDRATRNRDMGKLLRAIDRQMRIDWEYSRQLKERPLPKYLDKMIQKASEAEHEREVEAEKRKITIDLSQLGRIRSAAAVTREALLVDEEREDYVPGAEQAQLAATAAASTNPPQASTPVAAPTPQSGEADGTPAIEPADENPCDLTDLELEVARRIFSGKSYQDLLGPGKPLESILVDSINEKLFDEIGDAVIEFGDNGPEPIEDYLDDVRQILLL